MFVSESRRSSPFPGLPDHSPGPGPGSISLDNIATVAETMFYGGPHTLRQPEIAKSVEIAASSNPSPALLLGHLNELGCLRFQNCEESEAFQSPHPVDLMGVQGYCPSSVFLWIVCCLSDPF